MKIKGMLGLAAIGGAIYYVRKHGGLKNVIDTLKGKADGLLAKKPAMGEHMSSRSTSEPTTSSFGYAKNGFDRRE